MRRFSLPAVLMVVGFLAGCGDDGPRTPAAPPATSAPPYLPFDQAVTRYLEERNPAGVRFVGRCEDATPDPTTLCAVRTAEVAGREVYGIGAPASEIDAFLLMERGDGGWRVVDAHVPATAGDATPAPVPSWLAGVG